MQNFAPLFFLLFIFSLNCLSAQDIQLLREPSISPDGNQVTFSYQGDLWVASINGGLARRITIHEAYDSYPSWSPDGQQIAFVSSRFGNADIFVIHANSGAPRRITHFSGGDSSPQWMGNDHILFSSRRMFAQVEREAEIMKVSVDGGTPLRAMDATGLSAMPSPSGRYIAFVIGNCRYVREAYVGPANREIWVYDTQNDVYHQITSYDGQDTHPDWGDDNTLYFVSAESGRYNLYQQKLNNGAKSGEPKQMTKFTKEGIRSYDISADGKTAVIAYETNLYSKDLVKNSKVKKLSFNVTSDYRFDLEESKSYSSNASSFELSPNGKELIFSVNGEIFVRRTLKDKKRARIITHHSAREQNPAWLSDTTAIFISDRNGNNDLFLVQSADTSELSLAKTLKLTTKALTKTTDNESRFVLSHDKKQIAIQKGRGKLIVADIDGEGNITNERVLLDGWATPSGLSWSPDNKWLSYSLSDLDFNQEIYIHPADNSSKGINVSLHPRTDNSPVWSADGSKLGFLSDRNNGDTDVWFVWLNKADWEKTRRDWEDEEDDKKKEKRDSAWSIQIDFEDIHDRIEQVTRLAGNESNLAISKDGETFYYGTNRGGRQGSGGKRTFNSIKWDGSEGKVLLSGKSFRSIKWDEKHKNMYLLDGRGTLSNFNPSSKKQVILSFQAKMKMNYPEIRRQVFNEAWRAINEGFYDPQFHGYDWTKLRQQYEARTLAASTSQDFRDMFNELLGQLNASHMGMYGSNPEQTQRNRTGLLGIETTIKGNNLVISSILRNSPADREKSKLNIGEILVSINGENINARTNIYELLEGTTNERTLVVVRSANGEEREVVIRPIGSVRSQLYEDWVKERKALTEKYSNGQLGYIHIQGMNWPSFERFQRELTASGLGKKGIVIDVRFNGGGWTTDMLMTILNVRQHSYTIPRGAADNIEKENKAFKEYYPYGERLPFPAMTKPSIALCNQNSYSNAEIFSHAYKTLDIGTLVGQPTFGAVISTGGYGLMDGSFIRMPFRAWYVKATGENMEHGPAIPDIIVENAPDSKAKGEDEQLKRAVDELLNQLK